MTLPVWTREPLVHFLGLGSLLYLGLTWSGEPADPSSRMIEVGPAEQAELALGFERIMGRAPIDAELDARIENYVREEVLFREALRLGLDRGDAVVRQRLVAKMDMSASALAEVAEPSEETLRAFYEESQERYGGDALVSFRHASFPDRDAAETAQLAWSTTSARASVPKTRWIAGLPAEMKQASLRDVEIRFGAEFAKQLSDLTPGNAWQGPLSSGFGWHIVMLSQSETRPTSFEMTRSRIENDWRSAEIAARKQRAYEILRSAYRIDISR